MSVLRFVPVLMMASLASAAMAQAPSQARVAGVLTEVSSGMLAVKTDAGEIYAVALLPEAKLLKIAPGETDLRNAVAIAPAELAKGDRVLARGTVAGSEKALAASSLIVMSQTDLARKQEQDRAAWREGGVGGIVQSVNKGPREIVIRIPSMAGEQQLVVALSEDARLRRYAPGSVRFSEAKESRIEEILPGDQLRALGNKNPEGTRITASEVVTGAFRTVAGVVSAVNLEANEILLKELNSSNILIVQVTDDAVLKRMPAFAGAPAGTSAGGASPMGPGGPSMGPRGAMGPGGQGRPMGSGGFATGPGAPRPPDIQQMIERLPAVPLADIAPGETLVVSSTKGNEPDRLTAITILAGAEGLIAMQERMAAMRAQQQGGRPSGPGAAPWNLDGINMMPMP